MANYRRGRVNERLLQELSEIVREIKDSRVRNTLFSITAVDCTSDLKFAKVYVSPLDKNCNAGLLCEGLASAAGFVRTELARRVNMRITPELSFIADDSIKHGAYINDLLKQVEKKPRDGE